MATKVVTLQEFRDSSEIQTEMQLAREFGVAQSTMHRWLKRGDVFVELENGRWISIFVEKVLKERAVRKGRHAA